MRPSLPSFLAHLSLLTLAALPLACSGTEDASTQVSGQALYEQPLSQGNSYACATCHSLEEPAPDGLRRPGHAIGDAPRRTTFKNGQVDSFLGASNSCLEEWMNVQEPWTESSEQFIALRDFLLEEGADLPSREVEIEVVQPPSEEFLLGGQADVGRELFNDSCIVCHGADGAGTERAPRVTGFQLNPSLVAERIRLSGMKESPVYDGLTGGRMPFWSAARLTDQEVADISAYVAMSEAPEIGEESGEGPDVEPPAEGPSSGPNLAAISRCEATHAKVGQSATLNAFAHGVAGTVTVVDDCTLEFTDFVFDGEGINVQIYAGQGGSFETSMSGDIRRDGGYDKARFFINLPEGTTLDEIDAVSVWCVPVGVSFGDGAFQ